MKRAAILLTLVLWPALAIAGFTEVVRTVESSTGIRRIYIPFMGMARTFIRVVEPKGLSDFRIAVFEGNGRLVREDFDQALIRAMGPGWQKIVSAVSRRGQDETALIFARPVKNRMRMMIVAHQRDEAAVIELEVDLKEFSRFITEAQRSGRITMEW